MLSLKETIPSHRACILSWIRTYLHLNDFLRWRWSWHLIVRRCVWYRYVTSTLCVGDCESVGYLPDYRNDLSESGSVESDLEATNICEPLLSLLLKLWRRGAPLISCLRRNIDAYGL